MANSMGGSTANSGANKRILIIYNPTAGRARRIHFAKIKNELDCLGCEVSVQETTAQGDAESFARAAHAATFDVVVAAGGDGTINEVINGLIGRDLPLGVIALGTANALAAELDLPSRPAAIARVMATGTRRRCHVGQANGRHFMMMAGVGFDAHVVEDVCPVLKRLIGKGAYVWATITGLLRHTSNRYEVTVNGRTVSAASVVIGKGHYYGGRYICTPDAALDQASFQICLFKMGGPWATARYLLGLLQGTLSQRADVTLLEADRIKVDGRPADPVQGDGDIIARLPLEAYISEKTIDLLVPAS